VKRQKKMAPPLMRQRHFSQTGLVPVAVIRPVEVPVHVMAIKAIWAEAMVDAHRLEPIPEAARLGRLNKRHTPDRHSCQRAKNKPHDINLPGCNSPKNTAGGIKNLIRS
jgi:hypothetical protein